ncbi:hypothetical protein [Nocardia asteroides]|uniref:hypothetical protein n=1 Tax=Nocardia asteroides TaxID=1824 RepID=UPI0033F5DE6E
MRTATLHIDNLGGYPGPARVWKLDEPLRIPGGTEVHYLTIWVELPTKWQAGEVAVLWANALGAGIGSHGSVIKRGGSTVLREDFAGQPDYIDGAHLLALLANGYTVRPTDAEA